MAFGSMVPGFNPMQMGAPALRSGGIGPSGVALLQKAVGQTQPQQGQPQGGGLLGGGLGMGLLAKLFPQMGGQAGQPLNLAAPGMTPNVAAPVAMGQASSPTALTGLW